MRKRGTANPPKQVAHNKGKKLITDADFSKTVNNPVRMYVSSKMDTFANTEAGKQASTEAVKVSVEST